MIFKNIQVKLYIFFYISVKGIIRSFYDRGLFDSNNIEVLEVYLIFNKRRGSCLETGNLHDKKTVKNLLHILFFHNKKYNRIKYKYEITV